MDLPEQHTSSAAAVAASSEARASAPAAASGGGAPDRVSIAVVADAQGPFERELASELDDDLDLPDGEVTFTLWVQGDELDPDDVSRRLGCAPTSAHRKGETHRIWPSPPGAPMPPPRVTGTWLLEAVGDSTLQADELIESVLGRFPSEPAFWQPLHRDFTVMLHLAARTARWGTGFRLAPAPLARCTATGAPLHIPLHIYDPADP